jgi:hypothetical protein
MLYKEVSKLTEGNSSSGEYSSGCISMLLKHLTQDGSLLLIASMSGMRYPHLLLGFELPISK